MPLVLTYHRIVESPGEIKGFFDICAGELEAHLRAAASIWGESNSPGLLQKDSDSGSAGRRGFIVTFDDGTEDHYTTAAPVLERNGVRGVFFVNTSHFGMPGYLTLSQCRELQARGHAIESHSHEHKILAGMPEEELRMQLNSCRQRLRDAGLGQWDFLAVPGGYFNESVVEAARATGYRCLRTLRWGYNGRVNPFCVESITVNRKTSGKWFSLLVSPRLEVAKKAFYQGKELVKTRIPGLYFNLQKSGRD
jgi:peptidoglycan/xylan/chitin deacetylase (PgdA/CDA1 family)